MVRPFYVLLRKIASEFKLSFSILFFMRNAVGIDLYKLSLLKFLGRFINMVVMFLPLKAFMIMAGVSQIGVLHSVEETLGKNGYIILIIAITSSLYLVNVILNFYSGRLLNKQSNKFENDEYSVGNYLLKKKFFLVSHVVLINFLSDCLLVSISFLIFLYLSKEYASVFFILLLIYFVVIKYVVFIDNKFKFLERMNLDESQVLTISNSIFYLSIFISLFFVFIYFGLHVHSAILILLLTRLSNGSIKSIMLNMNKICKNTLLFGQYEQK